MWEEAYPLRPRAGGLEAERDTWVRNPRKLDVVAERDGQHWTVKVAGDARPTMRRIRIEVLAGSADSPFLLTDNSYDFRSVPRLVASVVRGADTDEERALALRELLIGEGFYFHFRPPPMVDPIHRLTNAGYGFCGQHAQIFEELARAAGLRVATCGHGFGYGHATNQVFYDGLWHFIDSNGEAFFRRPDGVIPSFDDIRKDPSLVPSGDAYGQTSFGIDGARYSRALFSGDTRCVEREQEATTEYGELRYLLRAGDSIAWEWEDASFSANRLNRLPVFGRGIVMMHQRPSDFSAIDPGVRSTAMSLTLDASADSARVQRRINLAYPPLAMTVAAKVTAGRIDARISRDNGATWLNLVASPTSSVAEWQVEIPDPDTWQDPPERHATTKTERMVRAGRYGYLLELRLTRIKGVAPVLRDLRVNTVFRQYPPALPILKVGDNRLTYVDDSQEDRRVRVTLEWEERTRAPGLSMEASAWGWGKTTQLAGASSEPGIPAALPAVARGPRGAVHAVYAAGYPGTRRIALRTYRAGEWSSEVLVTPLIHDASHPVAAEDAAGTIWIAYQVGGLWGGGDVWALSIRDGRPTAPIRMNTSDPYHVAFFPSITASGSRVTVAWEGGQVDSGAKTAWGTEVGWLRTFDGSTWHEPTIVKGEPFVNLGLPKVFYDTSGRLHLTGTKGPRYYRTMAPERSPFQWLSPEWVYHSRGGSFAADRAGNVWSSFDGQGSGTTNEIYVRMLPAATGSTLIEHWTKAIRISEDDKRPSIYPAIAADTPARVVVSWMDYRHGNAEVYAKVFSHGRWSPDLLISRAADVATRLETRMLTPNELLTRPASGHHSGYPRMVSAADGTTWVLWEERVDGAPHAVKARPWRPGLRQDDEAPTAR